MSFGTQVKEELCRGEPARKCCARAEAYGVLLFCHTFAPREIKVVTGSAAFAGRLPELFRRAFRLSFDQRPEPGEAGKRIFLIHDPDKLSAIREIYGIDPAVSLAHHINFAVLEEDHCRTAFLRGAFLTAGSVSDPAKGYHLELVTSHYNVSRELSALLPEVGFSPKQTTRKSNYITYFKSSETIADFLTAVGAPLSAMELMNAKLEKHLRGSVNRRVNCDSANLDKAVDAALGQVEAIERYASVHGLDSLPDKLRETAHGYGASVTEYLAAVLIEAILAKQRREGRRRELPVALAVPINLRPHFPSKTLRNFILTVRPSIDPELGDYTFPEIVAQVHHHMRLHISRQEMQAVITRNVMLQKNRLLQIVPAPLKNLAMAVSYKIAGCRPYSTTFTNPGAFQVPAVMEPHIQRMEVILGQSYTPRANCASLSFGNTMEITFAGTVKESEVERDFFRHLVREGIHVKVISNREE